MDSVSNSLCVNKVGLAADKGVKTSNVVKRASDSGPALVSLRTEPKRSLSGADSMTLPLHTLLAHTLHTLGRGVQRSTKSKTNKQTLKGAKWSLGRLGKQTFYFDFCLKWN